MDIGYTILKIILRTYLIICVESIDIDGEENLPAGPKIIVANHPNVTDGFVLPFIIREKVHFLIQAESFTLPIIGRIFALSDQIPVIRGEGRKALAIAKEKLTVGNTVAIFPEGILSHGEQTNRPRTGAAALALMSGAPVIPIGFYVSPEHTRAIRGRFYDRDTEALWQFGGRCLVQIGKPWRMIPTIEQEIDYQELCTVTEQIMARIENLVRQAKERV